MRLLLDSHVVLWWLTGDPGLSDEVRDLIAEEAEVYVSTASVWELGIKQESGKLTSPERLPETVMDAGFRTLPITAAHAIKAVRLPMIHRDPFDRVLIAQAMVEELTLITCDAHIKRYDVPVLAP
ncbi:type II toxin-antitoxin system VapC family toxin [Actinokineospora xionganensis]|uniref:Type II toxin-antitoxin system VapC family toxin n=1 Tax=Actinokineospora xionganensis TaxID=2684470 RepID=A0ABR7L995_9PSEU|nr:type II toxin-antitoxin system VapC family toxin [Actinokineospora xionganensis]MBC6448882.1 type II toxin-antitoxin system VapC family toxin [Actinokineospora xionganensis]